MAGYSSTELASDISVDIRNSEIVGFFLIGSFSSHDGQDKSVYNWAGPNYGASNSLANQMADAERDRAKRKQ